MATRTRWAVLDVFGDANEGHRCCSCCAGFCVMSESGDKPRPGPEMLVLAGDYVSDRYVAVKADLVDLDGWDPFETDLPSTMQVPAGEPGPESTTTFRPSVAARLLALGCRIVQGGGSTQPQHVYRDGEHIGWIMPATQVRRTLPEIRDLAETVARLKRSTTGTLADVLDGMSGPQIDNLALLRDAMAEDVA